ncbi:MAG: DUF4386 domain-containing protein [Thermomicrobiales bacterium]
MAARTTAPNDRRLALIAGSLYLVTFITSMPALALKTPFLDRGDDPGLATFGVILEVLLALACIGTAIALYPVTRRTSEPLALGFVASRVLEATIIIIGAIGVMVLVTLRDGGRAGIDTDLSVAFTAVHDWAFLLGPAVMAAVNALLLGSVLYRGNLVPRAIPALGLIGGPLLLASSVGVLFGAWTQVSPVGALAAVPIALWEFSVGVWLIVRGFRQEAVAGIGPIAV